MSAHIYISHTCECALCHLYTLYTLKCLTYLLSLTLTHTNPQFTHPQLNNLDWLPSPFTCYYSRLPIIHTLHLLIPESRVRVSRLSLCLLLSGPMVSNPWVTREVPVSPSLLRAALETWNPCLLEWKIVLPHRELVLHIAASFLVPSPIPLRFLPPQQPGLFCSIHKVPVLRNCLTSDTSL